MKRKLLTKTLGVILSAAIICGSIPANALPTLAEEVTVEEAATSEVSIDTGNEEKGSDQSSLASDTTTVSDNAAADASGEVTGDPETEQETPEQQDVKIYTLDELVAMDLLEMEDDHELSEILIHADGEETIWLYLQSLSQEQRDKLLSRDTFLTKDVYLYQFDAVEGSEDADGSVGYELTSEENGGTYYDYLQDEYGSGLVKAATWNTSGSMSFTFNKGGVANTVKLTLTVTSAHNNSADYAASVYIKVANTNNGFAIDSSKANSNTTGSYTKDKYPFRVATSQGTNGEGDYNQLWIPFSFTKPAGYTASYTINSGLNNSVAYLRLQSDHEKNYSNSSTAESTDKITTAMSMYNCVGSIATARNTEPVYTISLTPISYNVNYSGNGATSGTVSPQYCTYDKTYTFPANGYTRSYTVTYNGNDGTPDVASQTATYSFAGWKTGNTVYTAGTQYKNLTTAANSTVTMSATWNAASIKLLGAKRTGYKLKNWSIGSETKNSGDNYTPTANVTAKANWTPITYTISFNTNGGNAINGITATYDTAVALPQPTRAGYSFKGWKSESGTYTTSAINLSTVDGATVGLTAEWEAGKVNYTVNRYVEVRKNNASEYVLYQAPEGTDNPIAGTEIFQATADTQITVPAATIDGYVTPEPQLVTIAADGSTVIDFYYNLEPLPPNPDIPELDDIIERINALSKVAEMTRDDIESICSILTGEYGFSDNISQQLIEAIKNSASLSETQKKELLAAIASGYITEAQKQQLIDAIKNSTSLTEAQKQEIIKAINGMSTLSYEEQQKILQALESGSSASYTINGIEYTIRKNADGTLTIQLKGLNGQSDVVIPDAVTVAGKTYAVTEIAKSCFKDNTTIKTVTIGNNVAKIGESAFEGCTGLTNITFGNGLKEIGKKAFKNCSSLTSLSFPASLITIGDNAFENCTKLKTITLRNGLLQIGYKAFYNCKSLAKLALPKSVLKIKSYAFGKCVKMKTLTFADGSNLTTLGAGVFSNCKVLAKVKLPGKLTAIPNKTFANDVKLRSVTGGAKVTRIGSSAFENCRSLEKFTIPSKVQTIGIKSFYGCKKLRYVSIKTKALTSVGKQAFKKCKKGIRFKVPNSKVKSYTKLLKGKY